MLGISIKRRILLLALSAITLAWLAAAAFTYFDARHELEEMLDAHLTQSAALLLAQSSHEIEEIETEHAPLLHRYARHISFQIWEDGERLLLHSANAPQTPLGTQQQGFSERSIDGERWRVFSAWNESGDLLVQVAERAAVRNAIARNIAGNLLQPLWLALPLLALLLWLAVAHGLRPLHRLTRSIEQQQPGQLEPLQTVNAPIEVMPLIERLNLLFGRIRSLLDNERRFTANAAHELRTPVAAIKAQLQVARAAHEDHERSHALDGAIQGCDRATHLIAQMLTLARLETADTASMTDCPLRALAAQAIADIAPRALDQGVQLELAEGEELSVRGLPALLGVLLRNLLDNAVRYSAPGTLVRVEIARVAGRSSLSVSDNGPGVPAAELERIVEPFYRIPGSTASGSGLGLSIVQRIAAIHEAEFQLQNGPDGRGLQVRVMFRLP